ncbi:MAG: ATP-binding protein [Candidatus Izemoplasmatales bacterium]|nr:ATP-binding protein [Candidatus Izemoplasmatales bacterium]
MAKKQLSQEMIENIKKYSEEITTLEDFVAGVRQNIGMYIGSKGNKGFINMIREIIQNGFDEMMKPSSPCDLVKVSFDEQSNWVIAEDNGRGIPFDDMLRVFQDQHTSSNYVKKKGEYSSGLHGVGAKVTNALSEQFIVESFRYDGEARRLEFNDGHPSKKGIHKIPNPEKKQGTKISFKPSQKVLGELSVTWKDAFQLVSLILPLTNIGARVQFNAITLKGDKITESLKNEDGIMSFMINHVKSPVIKPIFITKDTGEMRVDVLFTYDSEDITPDPSLVAFANCCPTTAGTHIQGFQKGVETYFMNYMNRIFLANVDKSNKKKSTLTITKADIHMGLKVVVSAYHIKPIFDGQAKSIFTVAEMSQFVTSTMVNELDEWGKQNPQDLQKLCKYFKEIAQLRINADKEKVKLNNKYSQSLTGLPSSFAPPKKKSGKLEFWIVEGDSAAGGMRNNRHELQGYFPIRGKILNAFNKKPADFLNNAEVSGIINIIGGGYGKNFNINKVKWDKIIFGTDADADGDHISALLLGFFLMYMPELITAGRVYKAVPPLYGIDKGGKTIYLKDRMDYTKYLQKEFSVKHTIQKVDGTNITKDGLSKILYHNRDYAYEVEKVANGYSTDPFLLESVLLLKDRPVNEMKKSLKKLFRFIDVTKMKDSYVVSGVHDNKFQTIILNDRLLSNCEEIFKIMNSNVELTYKVDGHYVSLYEMMNMFEKLTPPSLTRFKGLGEMDGSELYKSTMNPDNRILIQYTMQDAMKELERVRYYSDNKDLLLKDVKVTRFDLLS